MEYVYFFYRFLKSLSMTHSRLNFFQRDNQFAKINLIFSKSLCENVAWTILWNINDINCQDRSNVLTCCDDLIWLKLMKRPQSRLSPQQERSFPEMLWRLYIRRGQKSEDLGICQRRQLTATCGLFATNWTGSKLFPDETQSVPSWRSEYYADSPNTCALVTYIRYLKSPCAAHNSSNSWFGLYDFTLLFQGEIVTEHFTGQEKHICLFRKAKKTSCFLSLRPNRIFVLLK